MGKEETRNSKTPRKDAIDFVTDKGKNNLQVDKWLEAGRPGKGKTPEPVQATVNPQLHPSNPGWATNAKKGFKGKVVETEKSYTVREDWDFEKGEKGKGYHVNASLGDRKVAFCMEGGGSEDDYRDRTKMLGERYHHDGPEEAAKWYQGRSGTR